METRLLYTMETRSELIAELSRVSLKRAIEVEGQQALAVGSAGTIVAVLNEGVAYLVEFTEPFEALAEVDMDDLEAIPGESRDDLLAGRMARRAS